MKGLTCWTWALIAEVANHRPANPWPVSMSVCETLQSNYQSLKNLGIMYNFGFLASLKKIWPHRAHDPQSQAAPAPLGAPPLVYQGSHPA